MLVMSVNTLVGLKEGARRGGEMRLRTAAELAGTIFPDEVMTHPLGMPATEV